MSLLPSDWDTVDVYGSYVYLNGEPAEGSITFTARQRVRSAAEEIAVLPGPIVVQLDAEGSFLYALPTTDDPDIDPSHWTYHVVERFGPPDETPHYTRKYEMVAPAGDPIDLTNVAPPVPPDEVPLVVPWKSVAGHTPNAEGDIVLRYTDLLGSVPSEALPPLAVTEVSTVADEAAMLALDAQRGDLAIRLDESRTYVLAAADATAVESWVGLAIPPDVVSSVQGRNGAVVLSATDVGLGDVNNTADLAKPVSTATQAALDERLVAGRNLTDVADAAQARTHLGLGGSATLDVGSDPDTVAAGDDPRIVRADRGVPVRVASPVGQETTFSTTTFNAVAGVSATFTAPVSGVVVVSLCGEIWNPRPGLVLLSTQVKAADGTVSHAANDVEALSKHGNDSVQASYLRVVTGLTPGASYVANVMGRAREGTGHVKNPSVTVLPQ